MPTSNKGLSVRTVKPSTLKRSSTDSRLTRMRGMAFSWIRRSPRPRLQHLRLTARPAGARSPGRRHRGVGRLEQLGRHHVPEAQGRFDAELFEVGLHETRDGARVPKEQPPAGLAHARSSRASPGTPPDLRRVRARYARCTRCCGLPAVASTAPRATMVDEEQSARRPSPRDHTRITPASLHDAVAVADAHARLGQAQLERADILGRSCVGGLLQEGGEPLAAVDVALLRVRTQLSSVHVLDHALA